MRLKGKKLGLLVLALLLVIGLLIAYYSDYTQGSKDSISERNQIDLVEKSDGVLHHTLQKNLSAFQPATSQDTPGYFIETNEDGIRTRPLQKSNNRTMILILGDSFIFGWGLNRSDRFTNIFEQELNERNSEEYRVINAGVPGYGMKDYYLFLKSKGEKYNPDIVIVAWKFSDAISSFETEKFNEEYTRKTQEYSEEERREYIEQIKLEYLQSLTLGNSSITRNMERIDELGKEGDQRVVFYKIWRWNKNRDNFFLNWTEENNISLLSHPPPKIQTSTQKRMGALRERRTLQ